MYTLTIVNSNNKVLTLTQRNDIKVDFLDGFYSSTATISTSKIGTKDGELITARTANKKNLGIYFFIEANVDDNRIDLYDTFMIKEPVTIYFKNSVRDVKIEAYVEDINIKPHSNPTTGQVILVSESAYFSDINETVEVLKMLQSSFAFPFALPVSGEIISWVDSFGIKNIYNTEAVPTGMLITMRKYSNSGIDVVNPIIMNEGTSESFSFNGQNLTSNITIYIDTTRKVVYKHDSLTNTTTNIFNNIAENSSWFQLKPGVNIFSIQATSGVENFEVKFEYTKKYQGV